MADLKTELMKLPTLKDVNFDDDGENTVDIAEPERSVETGMNLTQQIWEFIHKHPGCTNKEISVSMSNLDGPGVATRLNQMDKRGLISRPINPVTGKHTNHTITSAYMTLPMEERVERMLKGRATWVKKQAIARTKAQAKAAIKVASTAPKAEPKQPASNMADVELFVNRLTVADARNLYDALKRVFFS